LSDCDLAKFFNVEKHRAASLRQFFCVVLYPPQQLCQWTTGSDIFTIKAWKGWHVG